MRKRNSEKKIFKVWHRSSLKDLVYLASNEINVMHKVSLHHSGVCRKILNTCEVPVAIMGFLHFLCYTFCFYSITSARGFYCTSSLLHIITFNTLTPWRGLGLWAVQLLLPAWNTLCQSGWQIISPHMRKMTNGRRGTKARGRWML